MRVLGRPPEQVLRFGSGSPPGAASEVALFAGRFQIRHANISRLGLRALLFIHVNPLDDEHGEKPTYARRVSGRPTFHPDTARVISNPYLPETLLGVRAICALHLESPQSFVEDDLASFTPTFCIPENHGMDTVIFMRLSEHQSTPDRAWCAFA